MTMHGIGLDLGRDDWIRTSDPYVPNVVRYRAALHPEASKNRIAKFWSG